IEELADAEPFPWAAHLQETPDLGRDDVLAARLAAKEMVEPRLGKARAIKGGGVEIAHAGGPGSGECSLGVLFRDDAQEIADRRCAEAHFGKFDRGTRRCLE